MFIKLFACTFIIVVTIHLTGCGAPVVQKSWSKKECTKVLYTKEFSCNNLPNKYTIEWVK